MDRVRTVATFLAGVLVGASALYFSPPKSGSASGAPQGQSGPMMPPLPSSGQAGGLPGGEGMPPSMGQPGGDGTPPSMGHPGADGAQPSMGQGAIPGADGAPTGMVPVADPALPPPDGAMGPPPDDIPSAPEGTSQQSGTRLEKHLRVAESVWLAQAATAKASSKESIRALASELEVHAQNVPPITDHMPPMQDVAGYLATSRVLLDRMGEAGMDVADLSLQIDMMMRPPRGKIPGGPKSDAQK